jgi:hypothetical protein
MPTSTRPKTSVWIERMHVEHALASQASGARRAEVARRQQRQRQGQQGAEQRAEGGDANRRPGRRPSPARKSASTLRRSSTRSRVPSSLRYSSRGLPNQTSRKLGGRTRRRSSAGWRAGCARATGRPGGQRGEADGDQQRIAPAPARESPGGRRRRAADRRRHVGHPARFALQLAGGQPGVADRLVEGVVAADEAGVVRRQQVRLVFSAGADVGQRRLQPATKAASRASALLTATASFGSGAEVPDDLRILGLDQPLLDHRVAVAVVVGAGIQHALRDLRLDRLVRVCRTRAKWAPDRFPGS